MIIRRTVAVALGVLQLASTACYAYQPVRTTPQPGTQVALEVTDEGRVALNEKLGPGVVRVEGTLAGVESGDLLLDANAITQVRGYITDLGGVRVRLPQRFVTRIDERRLSRRRTLLVAGTIVGVVAAFFIAKVGGRSTPPEGGGGGGPDQ